MASHAAANAGRNYSRQVGWSGRFDSSWAYALWHERGHPVSSTLVAAASSCHAETNYPGECRQDYRDRAARRIFGGQVGCSNHPALPKGARSSV